jgi:hypothetical protein
LLDAKRVGYACHCGHTFFSWSRPFGRHLPELEKVRPLPKGSSDLAILEYWLTDAVAREELVDVLALVCERLIETLDGGTADSDTAERRREARQTVNLLAARIHLDFLAFCPLCGQPLSPHDDPRELYLDGFACSAGHVVWYRGSILYFTLDEARVELWYPHADAWLGKTLDDALGRSDARSNEIWEPLVHPQLRAALGRLRHYLP